MWFSPIALSNQVHKLSLMIDYLYKIIHSIMQHTLIASDNLLSPLTYLARQQFVFSNINKKNKKIEQNE